MFTVDQALAESGVPKEELYDVLATPEGQDRALAKLDTIKDDTIWWSAAAETPQLLADGEVVMGSTYNGRLFSAIAEQDENEPTLVHLRIEYELVRSSRRANLVFPFYLDQA